MTPELKGLYSTELDRPAIPADPEDCSVVCDAEIGAEDQTGADLFHFTVITRKRIAKLSGTEWGRGYLIVDRFSWEEIDRALGKLLANCARSSWEEAAAQLNQELFWEFERYQETQA
jgi:hypothetical protein